jgi:hypothetical protein
MTISIVFKRFYLHNITLTRLPIFETQRENKSLAHLTPAAIYEI